MKAIVKHIFSWWCILILISFGCSKIQYANVHVNVRDHDTQTSIGLDVYSGKDGQYVCLSPDNIALKKRSNQANPVLSLIVSDAKDAYKVKWVMVEISHWADSEAESMQSVNVNNISIDVEKSK